MEYKTIIGYSRYKISNLGEILNKRNKVVKSQIQIYYKVSLIGDNNIRKTMFLHRLLAIHFISNPLNLPCVNHKDGNKLNNNLSNLEWCTASENTKHGYDLGLNTFNKENKDKIIEANSRKVIDSSTGVIYNSIKEASIILTMNYNTIRNKINGNRKNNTSLKYYGK